MNFQTYTDLFEPIIKGENQNSPYDNPAFINYTKLNYSRQKRWLKTANINADLSNLLGSITTPQHWIVISEPWCGDAAHNLPFIFKMAELNPLINFEIQLRDSPPFEIDNYLTNGTKSIPKLIVKNAKDETLFTWGPRPEPCQALMKRDKAANIDSETAKINIQQWYNNDNGTTIQLELFELLKRIVDIK